MFITEYVGKCLGKLWTKTLPARPDRAYYEALIPPAELVGSGIPRRICQTNYSKELPTELKENIARIKSLNPGWSYELYDDADIEQFIGEYYPSELLRYFDKIHPSYGAAKADLFRYLCVYVMGGGI